MTLADQTITLRPAGRADVANISRLHARTFGPGRFARSAYRVREGKGHISRFCVVAERAGQVIGSARMTELTVGGTAGAALLGPVVVDENWRNVQLGQRLITRAIDAARVASIDIVILVGDEPYYGRYGFKPVPPGQIVFPGPVNPRRLLVLELTPDRLANYCGVVAAIPSEELDDTSSIAAQV